MTLKQKLEAHIRATINAYGGKLAENLAEKIKTSMSRPDRKVWDRRTKSYMTYPGIEPVQIEVGRDYFIEDVDLEVSTRLWYRVVRASTFKTGRRWTIRPVNSYGELGSCAFLYESEILEQKLFPPRLVVGMPWNHAPFNPHHSDHQINQPAA